ncbi:MAG: threonine--tRNA ligase [Candidatus Aeolococcus gillhamiae]|uniref:Threonine--tRNA ligase n=1 Tax=Candidatus Aeolococcus gillhamiae TaxID=3127015 RepID=A0A2W5YYV4_9BACT|nr:MAG: threonine--tRNA ligase [Candidatus Dormibacter sp. RRmetagenome_bin12]
MPDEIVDDAAEAGPPIDAPAELTLDILRHSAAHLMAAAVVELFPGAQYDVGPATDEGFFYNFRLRGSAHFSEEDLAGIEARMKELAKRRIPFEREVMARGPARQLFTDLDQEFKVRIIDGMPDDVDTVGVYRTGDFVDLCRGPHVPHTGHLRAVRLLRVAGVYWRGDERNEQLQRVYGTAFFEREQLDAFIAQREEARRRDHRRLGAELDLFSFPEEIGSGLPVFHPKGGLVRKLMEDYSRRRHEEAGYEFVNTPHITKEDLFQTSGHLQWFAEGMFPPMELDDGVKYYLKPMNCPFHILIYRSRPRSYRELPLRLFEFGTVYRYEKSGVVHGLTRVRGLTMDDSHIFCTKAQMGEEIRTLLTFVLDLLREFGLSEFFLELQTRPEGKAVGTDEEWEEATDALRSAASNMGLELALDEGGGTFYGPKISVQVKDAIGRYWQMSTIQVDLQFPQRFGLGYIEADGGEARPVMIHRALFGSIERFFGILLEHYAGHFPVWLAPVQCEIVPVQDDAPEVIEHVTALRDTMRAAGLRAEVNDKPGERMQARIRDAELRKVPYVVVVGRRDVERGDGVVNVRSTRAGTQENLPAGDLVTRLVAEAASRGQG